MAIKIDRDLEIVVANNIHSSLSYSNKRDIDIDLASHGDVDVLTFGQLRTMASSKSKSLLQKMYLLITDVYDDEVTVDDVIKALRLEKYYEHVKQLLDVFEIYPDSFDSFVQDSTVNELDKAMQEPSLKSHLTESAVHLYQSKDPNVTMDKLQVVLKANGIEDTFDYISDLTLR